MQPCINLFVIYNMKNKLNTILIFSVIALIISSCSKQKGCTDPLALNYDIEAEDNDGSCVYDTSSTNNSSIPTPSALNIPQIFAQYLNPPFIPNNNPLTLQGIELGRHLFFDPILSSDSSQACATCHIPVNAFTDPNQFSTGVTGALGDRNSMVIYNAAWNWGNKFFWDGRANSLEEQAFGPVVNPVEMNNTWPNAVAALQNHPTYPAMFQAAFGTSTIDSVLVAKALAQFERTLISANSKFDKFILGQVALSASELSGFNLFMDENGGDCFHCHGSAANPLWTDNDFHNNGLDSTFTDNGLGGITGNPNDNGKFKTPSLRNLSYSAPYMHDGRFATIDDVINHYSEGLVWSSTIDPLMKNVSVGGVHLSPQEKADLKAFLLTLNDPDFLTNPAFQSPF